MNPLKKVILFFASKDSVREGLFLFKRAFFGSKIPESSMSGDDISKFLKEISAGRNILEFGSGGSTKIFSEHAYFVTSVESDRNFFKHIQRILSERGYSQKAHIFYANVGPTRSYGQPYKFLEKVYGSRYKNYSLDIFSESEMARTAEIVFVDGRFRVACVMTSLQNINNDLIIIVDDFFDRPEYLAINEVLGDPVRWEGNAAIFDVKIKEINFSKVTLILNAYSMDSR